ncbi:MAG TPA: hypothetical protein VGP26_17120 [Actinophytocola sp.]|jgi:hypothetical protein|nr:hypothetical protein [Actinophytocola sp.]
MNLSTITMLFSARPAMPEHDVTPGLEHGRPESDVPGFAFLVDVPGPSGGVFTYREREVRH